jgi:hypothetical protein
MDDIFDCFAQVMTQGFTPNTLLLHPLTWVMFMKDPVMRFLMLHNAQGTWFATWTGNAATRAPWDNSSQGGMGYSGGQTITPGQTANGSSDPNTAAVSPITAYSQLNTSAPQLPGYMNIPFRIIVSPFVPYDPRRKLTNVYMFDSNELGVLIVDEDITTEEFQDPRVDIRKIKLRERYGIGILNEGKAIAVLKNVHVVPNEVVLPAQTFLQVANSTLGEINPTSAISNP